MYIEVEASNTTSSATFGIRNIIIDIEENTYIFEYYNKTVAVIRVFKVHKPSVYIYIYV